MKTIVLAVTLDVADRMSAEKLAAAVNETLNWVLFNDVEGAELLAYGKVEVQSVEVL